MKNTPKNCPIRNKKLFLIISISIAVIIIVIDLILFSTSLKQTGVGSGFSRFWNTKNTNIIDNNDDASNQTIIKDFELEDFTLEKNYVGDNKWEYTVVGQLATPCHSATVNVSVAESYPEQVTINVAVILPNSDKICAQVIQDFIYEGTFSASEQATVTLTRE